MPELELGDLIAMESHPGATAFDDLHALDYLEYAYLQLGADRKAREVHEEVAKASRFNEPNFAAGDAIGGFVELVAACRADLGHRLRRSCAGGVPGTGSASATLINRFATGRTRFLRGHVRPRPRPALSPGQPPGLLEGGQP